MNARYGNDNSGDPLNPILREQERSGPSRRTGDRMSATAEEWIAELNRPYWHDKPTAQSSVRLLVAERDVALEQVARLHGALLKAKVGLVPSLTHPVGHCSTRYEYGMKSEHVRVPRKQWCFVCDGLDAVNAALGSVSIPNPPTEKAQ